MSFRTYTRNPVIQKWLQDIGFTHSGMTRSSFDSVIAHIHPPEEMKQSRFINMEIVTLRP
ncbi:MAG TPA: hypothetical protein EYO80_02900 [Candidatus Marinimicrobia bacterium]|nr:hypothetical protein [Candidatus Neomarinimicrobiota bacterium]